MLLTSLLPAAPPPAATLVARGLFLDLAAVDAAHTTLVAVGEHGTILRSTDSGETWRPAATPPGTATLTAVAFADPQQGWATGHDATILATTDGGATWSNAHRGENPEDALLDLVAWSAPAPTAGASSPTLGARTTSAPARVLAVGSFGLALARAEAGLTWTRFAPQDSDLHLNRILRAGPEAAPTLFIIGESGTLLHSGDAGRTWTPRELPYDGSLHGGLVLRTGALLVFGLRGHLLRSADDGETWIDIGGQTPALLATGAELPDGRILLAGGARAWLESHDGGASFTPLPAPLLTTAIADLLVLRDGTLLACGEGGLTRIQRPEVGGQRTEVRGQKSE